MTQQEAQQKTVLSWLKDAHAMEVGAFPTLEDHAAAAEAYPEMKQKLSQHLEETRRHAELIEGCIERLGGHPAALKETVSSVMGKVTGIANLPAKDTTVKNALGDYAAENFEIACYTSLVAGAEKLGDQGTAEVCRQILQDEQEMASWLEGYIPTLTEQYLSQATDAPDAQAALGHLKQTAREFGDRGKKAASEVDTKNALLASGALLAGAGAALLVGQALRGNSDKDKSDRLDSADQQGAVQLPTDSVESSGLDEQGYREDVYDGYVTEIEVGNSESAEASSLLEPEPGATDDLGQAEIETEDVAIELVYTKVWLTPGPYTGIGPKNSQSAGDATGQEVFSRLTQHGQVNASRVEITVDNGEVLLEGVVNSEEAKRLAEEAVESISGVTKVQNLLQVQTA